MHGLADSAIRASSIELLLDGAGHDVMRLPLRGATKF